MSIRSRGYCIAICGLLGLAVLLPGQARNCNPDPAASEIIFQVVNQNNQGLARIRVTGVVRNIGNCRSDAPGGLVAELWEQPRNGRFLKVARRQQASLMPGADFRVNWEKDFNRANPGIARYRLVVRYLPANLTADQLRRADINLNNNTKEVTATRLYSLIVDNRRYLALVAGDGQKEPLTGDSPQGNHGIGTAKFAPLKVRLTDCDGQGVRGARVDFGAGTSMQMSVSLAPAGYGNAVTTTDSNGYATLNQLQGKSAHAYYATGRFRVNVTSDHAEAKNFFLEVLPNPAYTQPAGTASLTILEGDNQSVPRSNTASGIPRAVFNPLKVMAKDGGGRPISGATVVFTGTGPAGMAVQLEPSGSSKSTLKTDAAGIAVLNRLSGKSVHAYYADGSFQVGAVSGTARATFHLEVPAQAANLTDRYTLTIVRGDNQRKPLEGDTPVSQGYAGRARFADLVVRLTGAGGAPIANAEIGFLPRSSLAVQMRPGGGGGITVRTGPQGYAHANLMSGYSLHAYYGTGAVTVNVSADRATPVVFHLTVLPHQ